MRGADTGMRFFLSYVEHSGGLVDAGDDGAVVVLTEPLSALLALPETLSVTDDPETAREDGALLLAPGSPVLALSAEAVLGHADVGCGRLEWPADLLPHGDVLLDHARGAFPVDHGRIDPAGPPVRALLPVLRAGAMIRYVIAGDEAFQEQAECWLDATSCRELPSTVRAALEACPPATTPGEGKESTPVLPHDLTRATDAVHDRLRTRAADRLTALDDDGNHARTSEIARTEAYYRDVLSGIERRRANAAPDRVAALDARAEATRGERGRRLAEIREKHQARFELTPYRLHLLLVPAVLLPVDVMRGSRRYPQRLVWIWPARRFQDLSCPSCGSDEPLVAGKAGLGCVRCLARPEPAPAPVKPPAPAKAPASVKAPPPVRVPSSAKAPLAVKAPAARSLTSGQIRGIGDRLVTAFWQSVADGDRQLGKRVLPHSPAATALRLFGPGGLAAAIGVPTAAQLLEVSGGTRPPGAEQRHVSEGRLTTRDRTTYPFALVWRLNGNQAIVDEILPHAAFDPDILPFGIHLTPGSLRLQRLPGRPAALDPVAARLTDVVLPVEGLPLLLRCLTAWWRITDGTGPASQTASSAVGAQDPATHAAAILRMISYRSAERVTTARSAQRFEVTLEKIKAVEARLKPQLRLGPGIVW